LSVHEAAALVKASTEEGNINLQTEIMPILLRTLPKDVNCIDVLAAVQLPILQRLLELRVIEHSLQFAMQSARF
jgi:hypothetical protein